MSWFVSYVRSSVGAKQLMAVTGLGLVLFAIVHMIGHLGMFSGRDHYNAYAHFLQGLGGLKWIARGGLLTLFVVHMITGISLARANAAARPQKYVVQRYTRTTFYARTMALKVRAQARQPGQQAQVQRHRRRQRPGRRRRRRRDPGRARLQRRSASASRTRRAAPTRSPRRAASTPPRTTRTTATAIYRLFYDTVKGGDFRAREANVHRLAEVSVDIIDQCVAQGVPFAREYGGLLANRSFGGAQVSRTFYARGQTGQQLLIGAYQALARQIAAGKVKMFNRTEMLDVVTVDGRAAGIVVRDLVTGEDRVALGRRGGARHRRLRQRLLPVDQREGLQRHRDLPRAQARRGVRNPCYTQIHPTCIPVSGDYQSKLTLMSESLRNDGRVWVPKKAEDATRRPRIRRRSPTRIATTTSSASTRRSAT
jgi:succinate dehydrogenase/fumarate reductase cytochrome b subunit